VGSFDKHAQLGPGKVGMDPAAEAAIRAGNDVFAADDHRLPQNAVGDELRVFDKVGSVADDARHQHLARRQLRLLCCHTRHSCSCRKLPASKE
jgi:hypothetical protein